MDNLTSNLTSVTWWVSVVVVGLLVNLTTSYLRCWLDRIGASFSQRSRETQSRKKQEWDSTVFKLTQSPHQQILHAAKTNNLLMRSVRMQVLAVFFWGMSFLFFYSHFMYGIRGSGFVVVCSFLITIYFQSESHNIYLKAKHGRAQLDEAHAKAKQE